MTVIRNIIHAIAVVSLAAGCASAQLTWDKHATGIPIANPSAIQGKQDDVLRQVKLLVDNNHITLASETRDEQRGVVVLVTEPQTFARGIVATSQVGHFAVVPNRYASNLIQGRVAITIEITPSSPTTSLVGVATKFEGLLQAAGQTWTVFPSRGLLEDRVLKHLVMGVTGQAFDDVKPEDMILEPKSEDSGS